MGMAYIRKTYGVPAKRGMQVKPKVGDHMKRTGTILSATSSGRLVVAERAGSLRLWWGVFHPNDLAYLPANDQVQP